jgi:hypothetical protein
LTCEVAIHAAAECSIDTADQLPKTRPRLPHRASTPGPPLAQAYPSTCVADRRPMAVDPEPARHQRSRVCAVPGPMDHGDTLSVCEAQQTWRAALPRCPIGSIRNPPWTRVPPSIDRRPALNTTAAPPKRGRCAFLYSGASASVGRRARTRRELPDYAPAPAGTVPPPPGCHAGACGPPSVGTSEGYTSLP